MAVTDLSGPRKVVDLDSIPREKWSIDRNAVHIFKGKLRKCEPVGCVLCVDNDQDTHVTFSDADSETETGSGFYCVTHGDLVEVPYTLVRTCTIAIGDITREIRHEDSDSMLFPVNMTDDERRKLIDKMLDESEEESPAEDDE